MGDLALCTSARSLPELAAAAAAGERHAFDELVVQTSPAIFALSLRLVGNEHDARDVVQETYLRAYRAIAGFRGDSAVTTWLYRICANCASSHLTRRRRRRTEPIVDELDLADAASARALDAVEVEEDERSRLLDALGDLAPALRAVVVLHDIYDLDHDAIAAELGISRAASKVRLHRARRRLRELLFPALDAGEGGQRRREASRRGQRRDGSVVALELVRTPQADPEPALDEGAG